MATIEERAKKHSQRIFPCNNEYTERRIAELAYFHGVKEQEEIACNAFCNVCQIKECGGKGTKHCLWLTRFKKAMEE